MVQTGPKIQLGGLNEGFLRFLYQVGIAFIVKTEPRIPANSQSIINSNNVNQEVRSIFLFERNVFYFITHVAQA